jgi:dTDP-glucose 4,6-dehydratase
MRAVIDGNPNFYDRVKVITHDLTTPIDVVTALELGNPDVIINMASESHVDRSIEVPRPFIENNVAIALTMLEYARTLPNLQAFIQVSTDEVYGSAEGKYAHKEYDVILPSNPYAASKAAQEAIAISYWRTYDLPIIISNTMNILGERQDVEKFIPMTIKKLMNDEPILVHADKVDGGWVSGSRFYLHARNQADALCFTIKEATSRNLKYSQGLKRPTRIHVVGEREVKNDEMVNLIAKSLGKTPEIEYTNFHSSRPGHDMRYALGSGTLQGWGWAPPVPLEASLDKTIKWTLEHIEWLLPNG